MLCPEYDYYSSVKEKSDNIAILKYKTNNEMFKIRLYNLILNLCNQLIYGYTYTFSKSDLYFISENNIDIFEILKGFKDDIIIMKNRIS